VDASDKHHGRVSTLLKCSLYVLDPRGGDNDSVSVTAISAVVVIVILTSARAKHIQGPLQNCKSGNDNNAILWRVHITYRSCSGSAVDVGGTWTDGVACAGELGPFGMAGIALRLLHSLVRLQPAQGEGGRILYPLPLVHRQLAGPTCLPHISQVTSALPIPP